MLCQKADRNDRDTQHGAAGEGQQEDLGEKSGGARVRVAWLWPIVSVGSGEPCPCTLSQPLVGSTCAEQTGSQWEK